MRFVTLVAVAGLSLASAASAAAETITFSNLTVPNQTPFTTDTQGNFTVTKTGGSVEVGQQFGDPVPDLYVTVATGTVTVTRNNGGDFTFSSVDLATFDNSTFLITGSLGGASIFTTSGLISGYASFATYGTGFSSDIIDSLSIKLTDPSYEADLDNIVVTRAAAPAAVTPEPSSFLLLGTGLAGIAGTVRRRFQS